jgi:two-component system, LytTR family, response regulator
MKIKTLIVDDEPLARTLIKNLLKPESNIEIAGEAKNGIEALSSIRNMKPDLVFLDIQIPGMDGFEVLNNLNPDELPYIIFVTAYDQYTLKAFELHALDYLLKPVDEERFNKSLAHAIHQIRLTKSHNTFQNQIMEILKEIKSPENYLERITIKSKGKILFCKTEDIEWIEASGNYLTLHTSTHKHMLRERMGILEKKLDPKKFLRAHRSTIVNIDFVLELQTFFHGDYHILMKSGKKLILSRNYFENFKKIL